MLMEPRSLYRNRWFIPLFSTALGVLILGAFVIADDVATGLACLGLMMVVGGVFLFGGRRSETLAGLGGPGRDERWELIDLRATAFAGTVLIFALIGCWLWAIADGGDGSPYRQLMAVTGIAYIVGVALMRWRG
jgi:hypothetical protein